MNNALANGVGIGLPIVIGVVTALVLAWYASRNKPDA